MGEITGPGPGARSGVGSTLEAPPVQLPDPGGLSGQQVRGRACVWCAVALRNSTAVDLGVREVDAHGSSASWFPRGCRPCAILNAHKAVLDHSQGCLRCYDNPARCAEGQALRQKLREVRG
ncbi:hypothetical protein GCM10010449_27940 [Streptomyces rectiviolaceus]|uniref:Uncharacterized protein n=1 Tax=Streptomyces rectiviolaceus TaxID=332591 RepID=A0ABP6MDK2_9ACTN